VGSALSAEQARIIQLLVEAVTYDAWAGDVAITFRAGGCECWRNKKRKAE
jgi:hypothetical protein